MLVGGFDLIVVVDVQSSADAAGEHLDILIKIIRHLQKMQLPPDIP